jgi:serine/threonine protein kinase
MTEQVPLTPERWRQIEQLFSCLEERPADRAALLAAADPDLRQEVEKMVAASQAPSPLDDPAPPIEPDDRGPAPSVLGPYRIEALLGQGGIGRVFRATDTRLHRSVAIKILAERFSERFEREARAIAALNHPHICTLHDVGPAYLVMELVEGETLAARLQRGRLPLERTVEYGAQIASALAAAHAKGIIHRDLKPANIMLTRSGVKYWTSGCRGRSKTRMLRPSGSEWARRPIWLRNSLAGRRPTPAPTFTRSVWSSLKTSFPELFPDGKTLVYCSDKGAKSQYEFNIFVADWQE